MTPEDTDQYLIQTYAQYPKKDHWLVNLFREHLIRGPSELMYNDGDLQHRSVRITHCSDRAREELRPMIAKLRLIGITIHGWDKE